MRLFKTALAACVLAAAASAAHAQQRQIKPAGLSMPECIRYDAVGDRWIVSNRGGDAPNDGFISLMAPDGSISTLKWIEGGKNGVTLNDPLGVFVTRSRIYVADTAAVHVFDRATGAPVRSTPIPGAIRLNDLTVSAAGDVYVTDTGSDETPGALFRIAADGTLSTLAARSADLQRPNGIAVTARGNIVHGGRGNELYYRAPTGQLMGRRTLPTGRFDGIVALAEDELLVASQDGHVVYRVPTTPDAPVVVAKDLDVPAAIGFDTKRRRLAVPQIRGTQAGTVTFVEMK